MTRKSPRIITPLHHPIQGIREPYCRSFKLLSTKMWNFIFLARKEDHGCVFIYFFFPRGDRIDPVVLECGERAHSNRNEKL